MGVAESGLLEIIRNLEIVGVFRLLSVTLGGGCRSCRSLVDSDELDLVLVLILKPSASSLILIGTSNAELEENAYSGSGSAAVVENIVVDADFTGGSVLAG